MRLLVDEDLASRELLARLEHFLPRQVSHAMPGTPDDLVWQQAQADGAAVLTANVRDFLRFIDAGADHHGLLLVHRTNDRLRDLRFADIATGVAAIVGDHPGGLHGLVFVVDDVARRASSM